MDIKIRPSRISGELKAIVSKSYAHRMLILAALGKNPIRISIPELSKDIEATINCLRALGAEITEKNGIFEVIPLDKNDAAPKSIDCGESGSTLRFLMPVAAALPADISFSGHGRLPERKLEPLISELKAHGAIFSSEKLPFTISGRAKGGKFTLPGNVSSQFITGLLLAEPLLEGSVDIHISGILQSAAYVDITYDCIKSFNEHPEVLYPEGDWSNAAFFLALGALGGPVKLSGLNTESVQGDRAVFELIKNFGANIENKNGSVYVSGGKITGTNIDVSGIPDLFPVLAVIGALAEGETLLFGGERLRDKESDRIESTAAMLKALGAKVYELPDGLKIEGSAKLSGGEVFSANDHRIVMAAAVAAANCEREVIIRGAEAVEKSYPGFFADYNSIGGDSIEF
ncbi:MAG: 3-phosphoshikimate 1-carboxyvinyltransferase [Firmicutes bacterium]|nr:3-phosphoshikimate 1-carboxyvinyltransferase [Bacillota bacterium]